MSKQNSIKAGSAWTHVAPDGIRYKALVVMQGPARTLRVLWSLGGREVVRIGAPMERTRRAANAALDSHVAPEAWMAGPI